MHTTRCQSCHVFAALCFYTLHCGSRLSNCISCLAYELGYGEIGLLKDGKLSINGGRFLTVCQRQANGDWKILRNVALP